jgi:hypothetical protein
MHIHMAIASTMVERKFMGEVYTELNIFQEVISYFLCAFSCSMSCFT